MFFQHENVRVQPRMSNLFQLPQSNVSSVDREPHDLKPMTDRG